MIFVIFAPRRRLMGYGLHTKVRISRQNSVNHNKTDFASTQSKLWWEKLLVTSGNLFHMTSNKCMWSKIAFNVEHFSSTKHAEIFIWSKTSPHEDICSTDNVHGVRNKYHASASASAHTWYLSFLLHGQGLWVIFCSTQKCVNRDKIYFAPKQRKSQ